MGLHSRMHTWARTHPHKAAYTHIHTYTHSLPRRLTHTPSPTPSHRLAYICTHTNICVPEDLETPYRCPRKRPANAWLPDAAACPSPSCSKNPLGPVSGHRRGGLSHRDHARLNAFPGLTAAVLVSCVLKPHFWVQILTLPLGGHVTLGK